MDFEKLCFDSNKRLIENFAKEFNITTQELENNLKLVAKHEILFNMSLQINQLLKTNPNACINFGEYGEKISKELNIDTDVLYNALLNSGYNELLINIVTQLKNIYSQKNN